MALNAPYIPRNIVVHLGTPGDDGVNITVDFVSYIKNVASSEIYPTWPDSALRANIYAIITFALNRVYTEYYRSRGYSFDITNNTQYDQAFVRGREIFEPISKIVDQIFDSFVVKDGQVQPYYTQYCSGRGTTCKGLSQWGTVTLAENGLTPYQILRNYYGNVGIKTNVAVRPNVESYPGRALRLGSGGEEVRIIQRQLNRIRENFPAIPKIPNTDGIFSQSTRDAVVKFQEIFNLTPDGIVGRVTWYKIKNLYNGVKNLNDLQTEGLTTEEISRKFDTSLKQGSTGNPVKLMQYYLRFIDFFNNRLNQIDIDGIFGSRTRNAVIDFQRRYSLAQDGIIGRDTWNKIIDVYNSILNDLPNEYKPFRYMIYPGYILTLGQRGEYVRQLQLFLRAVASVNSQVRNLTADGIFGKDTEASVKSYQRYRGFNQTGYVDANLWEDLRQDFVRIENN